MQPRQMCIRPKVGEGNQGKPTYKPDKENSLYPLVDPKERHAQTDHQQHARYRVNEWPTHEMVAPLVIVPEDYYRVDQPNSQGKQRIIGSQAGVRIVHRNFQEIS